MPRLRFAYVCGFAVTLALVYSFWPTKGRRSADDILKYQPNRNQRTSYSNNLNDSTQVIISCKFPSLELNDPELAKFFHEVGRLKCNSEPDWVTVGNGTFEIIADEKLIKDVTCDYNYFRRETDHKTVTETVESYPSGSELKSDFFTADCRAIDVLTNAEVTQTNVYAGIRPSQEAIERARNKKLPENALKGMNVYLMGFDSISRMTFMRKMKHLYAHITKNYESVVLEGYNIVGDGTPQALIPILTGKTEEELPLTRKRYKNAQYVNVYPFAWQNFSDAGYVTLYGEDAASIGTFTYRLKGFKKQPTDHYMRTFYTVSEKQTSNKFACIGSLPQHKVHFQYVEKFFEAYPTLPKFAFQFHSVLSHGNINEIQAADEDMVAHLKLLEQGNHLNNTMLLVFADHGHRFADIRRTQQGKMEERLPFFSIAMPKWFREAYPQAMQNLRTNAKRLTSPFDIHPTLLSVLNFEQPQHQRSLKGRRSISLFDEVPAERTCNEINIASHWCTCLQWQSLKIDAFAAKIAEALIAAINAETERERKLCAPLRLLKVDRLLRYAPEPTLMRYKTAKDYDGFVADLSDDTKISKETYQINFITTPGDAYYEASVGYVTSTQEIIIDLNNLSHVNAYGNLPACVIDKDYFLAKYCVCYDKIGASKTP